MNTVRATKRLIPTSPRLPGGVDRLAVLALVALCAVLFICFFALARALSPTGHASSAALPAVLVAPTGDEVPLRLTAAPAMQAGALVTPKPVARSEPARRPSVPSASGPAPVTTSTTPAAAAPTPEPTSATPVAAPEPAKAPAPAKAPKARRAPAPRNASGGGGTSFDSSG